MCSSLAQSALVAMGCGCGKSLDDLEWGGQPGRTVSLESWHLTTEAGGPREPNRTMHEAHLQELESFLRSAHRNLEEEVTMKRCCDELRTAVLP